MNVAWQTLARDRARLLVSVGGVGFAVLLILLLRGLYVEIADASTAYVRGVDADVWVAQEGTAGDFSNSVPVLNERPGEEIEAVAGVVDAAPLLGGVMQLSHDGRDADFFLLRVDPDMRRSAPATVEVGTRVPNEGGIVVDRDEEGGT